MQRTDNIRIAGILIVIILVASIVAAWCLMHFGYTITEEKHKEIVIELEKRHREAEVKAGETPEAEEPAETLS